MKDIIERWKVATPPDVLDVPLAKNQLRRITATVDVVTAWSDKIIESEDECTGEITYTSGWVFEIVQPRSIIYNGQQSMYLASMMPLKKEASPAKVDLRTKAVEGLAQVCMQFALDDSTAQLSANICGVFLTGMGFSSDDAESMREDAMLIVRDKLIKAFGVKE